MEQEKVYTVIGLMSGTSADGIDAALIRTDGLSYVERLGFMSEPYDDDFRHTLKAQFGKPDYDEALREIEKELTDRHAHCVKTLIEKYHPESVDLIGFHGQSIFHDPDHGVSFQIGDGARLAQETGVDVVYQFRQADVQAGGQGAPLIPIYHQALAHECPKPCVFLNIGGVSNVTWMGAKEDDLLAFDCGPGNALIDDCVSHYFDQPYDEGGQLAQEGHIDKKASQTLMEHPFFEALPPKSLDRNPWDITCLEDLSPQDKIATLTDFSVQGIVKAQEHMPEKPRAWYVCGGGRHNQTLMNALRAHLAGEIYSVDEIGLDGDALEAEGFAYLAVRSIKGYPLSFPTTTGVSHPQTGGVHITCRS